MRLTGPVSCASAKGGGDHVAARASERLQCEQKQEVPNQGGEQGDG